MPMHHVRPPLARPIAALAVGIAVGASGLPAQPGTGVPMLERLRREAAALEPHTKTDAVREWLRATERLTPITPRSIYFRQEPRAVLSAAQFLALPEAERSGFQERPITEETYYATNYGTPLCYARALDLAAEGAGLGTFRGTRILDYGYGQMGQLRMLAACGAEAVGVDPAAGLGARYSLPEDQGAYPPGDDAPGSVKIVTGFWPGEDEAAEAVGGGFDAIIARNVLKHGYVRPIAEVPAWAMIDLSVGDEEFLGSLYGALNPGGVLVIYNLGGPRLRNGAYDPAADINCPWTRAMLEQAGFEVLEFDADDSEAVRAHAVVFGWARPTDPLRSQWFALYTVARRPA